MKLKYIPDEFGDGDVVEAGGLSLTAREFRKSGSPVLEREAGSGKVVTWCVVPQIGHTVPLWEAKR
ncbi:MAG: hypothetical protein LKG11_01630 [Bacilli bacterium]|jgi:hypothetical protein|nr:hypothetical protein [Bacilli bacterium]